jgi:predicted double-glycine peptidase
MNIEMISFIFIMSFNFLCSSNQTSDIQLVRKPNTLELFQNKQKIELLNLPDVRQSKSYTCGPSSLQAVLMYYGIEKREDILAELA